MLLREEGWSVLVYFYKLVLVSHWVMYLINSCSYMLIRWWKNLDFVSKLPFARDRLVELYFWILGVYFEPQYSLARRRVTKVIAMTSVLDDIYDIYGTPEELKLLTDAMERFSI